MSVKLGYCDQFYLQQLLSENVHFQIFSSEDYFIYLTSTPVDLLGIVKISNNEKPSAVEGLSNEVCVLHSLFRQISIYINRTLVSTSRNLSNYASYMWFMLMTPKSYKKLRGLAIAYAYKTDTDTTNILLPIYNQWFTLCWENKSWHFNAPQWMPPNVEFDLKLKLIFSNFIFRTVHCFTPDVTVALTLAMLHVRKQMVIRYVSLAIEKLRASWNNIPFRIQS